MAERRYRVGTLAQLYPEWELCVADDASTEPHVRHVLEGYAAREPRIRFSVRSSNGGIAAASQTALSMGTGEFVALLDHDDELAPHALFHIAKEIGSHSRSGAALHRRGQDQSVRIALRSLLQAGLEPGSLLVAQPGHTSCRVSCRARARHRRISAGVRRRAGL